MRAKYTSTLPTIPDGDVAHCQLTAKGSLLVALADQTTGAVATNVTNGTTDANSASTSGIVFYNRGLVYNGTGFDRMRGDTHATSVLPGLSSTFWSYTSGASPILSNTTTAVTIKASAGASVRNYITSIQLTTTAFGASVPLAIRDGAGGTVLWAVVVPTAGFLQPVQFTFPVPLKGTAATLLEIVTTTANTSGTVTANIQGFTGA